MALPTAVVASVAAAVSTLSLLAAAVMAVLCWRRLRARRSRTSDTGSSETPPTLAEWGRCGRTSSAPDYQGARRFSLEEMSHATKNFSDANLVGAAGSFGKVYMGLLLDGTVVAIKRREAPPRQDFVDEVRKQSEIWHRNVVTLIGYCQEGGLQMLVFEYLPNGSVCGHLYDSGKESMTRLEFKQRLSIAIGAAKGLDHLHSMTPPLIHKGFKTSNVLVDENFIAKVSDAGVDRLLRGLEDADKANGLHTSVYQDPEVHSLAQLSASKDVYSFGVFLLELITGRQAAGLVGPESTDSLPHWMEAHFTSGELVDPRLGGSFTSEGMKELVALTFQCLSPSVARRRPKMRLVAEELDRILEKEMTLTTVMGDGTAIITLGSQLFTS
ncbi:probable serine/threonine-protein kinase PBL22 [Lolium perenne]|uniref:probable serine/threonine-protein kinase PBL22 n=1 Tax=Lolium perenne TaxID=4522 RepID=UPI0021EABF48|nr:probable serine/threonine-protein kinase PBL22 [Lolium perenne]